MGSRASKKIYLSKYFQRNSTVITGTCPKRILKQEDINIVDVNQKSSNILTDEPPEITTNESPNVSSINESLDISTDESPEISTNESSGIAPNGPSDTSINRCPKTSTNEPPNILINKSLDISTNETPDISTNQSPGITSNEPPDWTLNETPINRSLKTSTNEPPNILINESLDISTNETPDISTNESLRPTTNWSPDISINRSSNALTNKSPQISFNRSPKISNNESPELSTNESLRISTKGSLQNSIDESPQISTISSSEILSKKPLEIVHNESPEISPKKPKMEDKTISPKHEANSSSLQLNKSKLEVSLNIGLCDYPFLQSKRSDRTFTTSEPFDFPVLASDGCKEIKRFSKSNPKSIPVTNQGLMSSKRLQLLPEHFEQNLIQKHESNTNLQIEDSICSKLDKNFDSNPNISGVASKKFRAEKHTSEIFEISHNAARCNFTHRKFRRRSKSSNHSVAHDENGNKVNLLCPKRRRKSFTCTDFDYDCDWQFVNITRKHLDENEDFEATNFHQQVKSLEVEVVPHKFEIGIRKTICETSNFNRREVVLRKLEVEPRDVEEHEELEDEFHKIKIEPRKLDVESHNEEIEHRKPEVEVGMKNCETSNFNRREIESCKLEVEFPEVEVEPREHKVAFHKVEVHPRKLEVESHKLQFDPKKPESEVRKEHFENSILYRQEVQSRKLEVDPRKVEVEPRELEVEFHKNIGEPCKDVVESHKMEVKPHKPDIQIRKENFEHSNFYQQEIKPCKLEIECHKVEVQPRDLKVKFHEIDFEPRKLEAEPLKVEIERRKSNLETSYFNQLEVVSSKFAVEACKLDVESCKLEIDSHKLEIEMRKVNFESSNCRQRPVKPRKLEGETNTFEIELGESKNFQKSDGFTKFPNCSEEMEVIIALDDNFDDVLREKINTEALESRTLFDQNLKTTMLDKNLYTNFGQQFEDGYKNNEPNRESSTSHQKCEDEMCPYSKDCEKSEDINRDCNTSYISEEEVTSKSKNKRTSGELEMITVEDFENFYQAKMRTNDFCSEILMDQFENPLNFVSNSEFPMVFDKNCEENEFNNELKSLKREKGKIRVNRGFGYDYNRKRSCLNEKKGKKKKIYVNGNQKSSKTGNNDKSFDGKSKYFKQVKEEHKIDELEQQFLQNRNKVEEVRSMKPNFASSCIEDIKNVDQPCGRMMSTFECTCIEDNLKLIEEESCSHKSKYFTQIRDKNFRFLRENFRVNNAVIVEDTTVSKYPIVEDMKLVMPNFVIQIKSEEEISSDRNSECAVTSERFGSISLEDFENFFLTVMSKNLLKTAHDIKSEDEINDALSLYTGNNKYMIYGVEKEETLMMEQPETIKDIKKLQVSCIKNEDLKRPKIEDTEEKSRPLGRSIYNEETLKERTKCMKDEDRKNTLLQSCGKNSSSFLPTSENNEETFSPNCIFISNEETVCKQLETSEDPKNIYLRNPNENPGNMEYCFEPTYLCVNNEESVCKQPTTIEDSDNIPLQENPNVNRCSQSDSENIEATSKSTCFFTNNEKTLRALSEQPKVCKCFKDENLKNIHLQISCDNSGWFPSVSKDAEEMLKATCLSVDYEETITRQRKIIEDPKVRLQNRDEDAGWSLSRSEDTEERYRRKISGQRKITKRKYPKNLHLQSPNEESAWFPPPGSQKPLWSPPRSPHNLIEESLYHNPWSLLVATIFLNKTSMKLAGPYISTFLRDYDGPESVIRSKPEDLEKYFVNIGLKKRSIQVWRMSHDFLHKKWKNVGELYGIGRYGVDAHRIFCLGNMEVEPKDRFLRIYRAWYEMFAKKEEIGGDSKKDVLGDC